MVLNMGVVSVIRGVIILSGSAIAYVTHAWIVKRVVVRYIDDVNYTL